MKYSFIIIAIILLGCNKLDKITGNKPYLELSGSSPYDLRISEFRWGYGRVAFNEFSGDFKKLDEKVFDLLKGKEGTVKVFIDNVEKDQYGRENSTSVYIGDLNLSELNKYEDWEYWNKHSGIQTLLYETFVKPPKKEANIDKAIVSYDVNPVSRFKEEEVADSVGSSGELYRWNNKTRAYDVIWPKTEKSFLIKQTDLYPDPEERANQDYQSYTNQITGKIKAADFYHGTLEVQGDDGDYYALRIEPDNLPTSLKSDLRFFLKPGNTISCICTRAGARELIIVSAKFTSFN